MWGVLPFRYHFHPKNHRWSLGSHDIVFTNKFVSKAKHNLMLADAIDTVRFRAQSYFFSLGQVLPTHRNAYSKFGGLFQPTLREAVRLLSRPDSSAWKHTSYSPSANAFEPSQELADPFSSPAHAYTYTTNGIDCFPSPSAYSSRQYSWIHIFPEGRIHQHAQKTMRYFKWGVARLILEPDVCPDIIPVWIEGNDQIMHESRAFPKFLPRIGKKCGVWFGQNVGGDTESIFHELRSKWRKLVEENRRNGAEPLEIGVLNEELRIGKEAVLLREECTRQVRKAVLKVRHLRGLPDEDPKSGLVETWREEGVEREGKMEDGSWVKDI